jgi:hypothetical protein
VEPELPPEGSQERYSARGRIQDGSPLIAVYPIRTDDLVELLS